MTIKQRQDLAAYVKELTAQGRHAEAAELYTLLQAWLWNLFLFP